MAASTHTPINAAHVADAVFTSILLQRGVNPLRAGTNDDLHQVQLLMESIDQGLKTAGMSFAEYLERVRQVREVVPGNASQRWRFSARERAVQRVDHAMVHLCALVQTSGRCA
jgi:hypothetical protein